MVYLFYTLIYNIPIKLFHLSLRGEFIDQATKHLLNPPPVIKFISVVIIVSIICF